jgi:acyl carrier protein
VLLRRRKGGVSVLSAYFTADTRLNGADLRTALLEELPEYMVPSAFLQVDAMPLTNNQKVDRTALAALEPADATVPAVSRRAPRTELESEVLGIFADVLGLASMSIDDDFFDRGGHSMLAMRLWSRLRSGLGVELELSQVLDTPTVAGLVASLERESASAVARPKLVRRS